MLNKGQKPEHFASLSAGCASQSRLRPDPIKAQKPVSKCLFFIRKRARALLVIFAYNFVSYDKNR